MYISSSPKQRGFTLIELLVVLAIIGMLTSVVLGSLNMARAGARDAAIKAHVRQVSTMMNLLYSDTGSYAALQIGWDYTPADCASGFSGTYAGKMREICAKVTELNRGSGMYTGVTAGGTTETHYSVMAFLPGKGTWYCVGSGGGTSDSAPLAGPFTAPGCPANP